MYSFFAEFTLADSTTISDFHINSFCSELIGVGLAEKKDYDYIRFDPALFSYLNPRLSGQKRQQLHTHWLEMMSQLLEFLHEQKFKNTKLQSKLTQLELPNLMSFINTLSNLLKEKQVGAEEVTYKASLLEQLLEFIDFPQALAKVVSIRREAAELLVEWDVSNFNSQKQNIERFLAQSDLQQAFVSAGKLLQRCKQAGETAYIGADFDLAMSIKLYGLVLTRSGAASKALPYLQQAQKRFDTIDGKTAYIASLATLSEQGECWSALGVLEKSVLIFQKAIRGSESLGDTRGVAVKKARLASVFQKKRDYVAAQQNNHEALQTFQQLNEQSVVATIWHQIGVVHWQQRQFEQAESAYQKSLLISSQP